MADCESYRCVYVSPQIEMEQGFTVEEWLEDPELWVKQLHEEDEPADLMIGMLLKHAWICTPQVAYPQQML